MNRLKLIGLLLPLLFAACSDSMITDLARLDDDPIIVEPTVLSFTDEFVVEVQWDEDSCADEYILYRSIDGADDYSIVSQGVDTEYTDTDVEDEGRYLYCLVKVRGTEYFGPSESIMGVGNSMSRDEFEPNDSEEDATAFEYDLEANTYYYVSDEVDYCVEDIDWYSIEISPQVKVILNVVVSGTVSSGATDLIFYQNPNNPEDITSSGELTISNTTYTTKTFYFCIYPDGANVVTNSSGGGDVISYELNYMGEYPL